MAMACNVAARIQALADPGGVYISRGAADQVRDKVPIKIETRGEQTVKNIARPIEVFCVIADDHDRSPVAAHQSERVFRLRRSPTNRQSPSCPSST